MENFLVSIIIINYNGQDIIKDCVESTLLQSHNNNEIIVIDNNSSDKSLDILSQYQKSLKIVRSEKNLGCPGARNLALKYCKGKYVAFIDNDGRADRDWIEKGVKKMEQNPAIGAIAPLVLFAKENNLINGIGGFINKNGAGEDYLYRQPLEKVKKFPSYALYPMGCGMIIRADIFKDNEFDEVLFNYYDDADMGIKIWSSGYRIATESSSVVYHLFSQSDKYNKNKVYLCERNRIYTHLKYLILSQFPAWILKETIREIAVAQIYKINFFSIWWWNIKNFNRIKNRRKKNNNMKNIFPVLKI